MHVLKTLEIPPIWLDAGNIKQLINRKNPSELLKSFREFVKHNPSYFGDTRPLLDIEGATLQYNFYAFVHFYENRDLLEAGSRSVKFDREEARRIRESYLP